MIQINSIGIISPPPFVPQSRVQKDPPRRSPQEHSRESEAEEESPGDKEDNKHLVDLKA